MARKKKIYDEKVYSAWYHLDDIEDDDAVKKAARRLNSYVTNLESDQTGRLGDMLENLEMYANRDIMNPNAPSYPTSIVNVTQAIVDQLVAKQVVNKSKASFDVDDGDFEAYQRSEQMGRFTFGEFLRLDGYKLCTKALRHAYVTGRGSIKFWALGGQVKAEVTCPMERFHDPQAALTTAPTEDFQVRYVKKGIAASLYPELAFEIMNLKCSEPPYNLPGVTDGGSDYVRLVEAWHLPVPEGEGPGSKGCRMFICGDVVLACDEYTRSMFPFVDIVCSEDLSGGYPIGLAEQLKPLQRELNKLKVRKLQGIDLFALPMWVKQKGSVFTPDASADVRDMGRVYESAGGEPKQILFQGVSPDVVAEEANIISQMYQLSGISPLERGADSLSRVDSRPGFREMVGRDDERHALISDEWQNAPVGAARQIIDVARDIVKERGSYTAFGAAKDFVTRIDFAKCDLSDERFRIRPEATSLLPTQIPMKRLALMDFAKANMITDINDMWEMLATDHPDIAALSKKSTAASKLCKKQLYSIVNERKYVGPDMHQPVDECEKEALSMIQLVLLKSDGAAKANASNAEIDAIVSDLDRYIAECKGIRREVEKQKLIEQQKLQAAVDSAQAMQAAQGAPPNAGSSAISPAASGPAGPPGEPPIGGIASGAGVPTGPIG